MNHPALVTLPCVAALAVVACLPRLAVAASGDAACQVRAGTALEQRVEQESQKGIQSLGRFIHRTRNVYQLDLRTEVAKIDARRQAEQDCLAGRDRSSTTAGVDGPASSPSVASAP